MPDTPAQQEREQFWYNTGYSDGEAHVPKQNVVLSDNATTPPTPAQQYYLMGYADGSKIPPATPQQISPTPVDGGANPVPVDPSGLTQAQIAAAAWQQALGSPEAFQALATSLKKALPPMQMYAAAAAKKAYAVASTDANYAKQYAAAVSAANAQAQQDAQNQQNQINTGLTIAATVVNVIPVVGQALSAAILIGAALYNLVQKLGVLPSAAIRNPNVPASYQAVEGGQQNGTYKGILITGGLQLDANGYPVSSPQTTSQGQINADPNAGQLPLVPAGTQFWSAPTLTEYNNAAAGGGGGSGGGSGGSGGPKHRQPHPGGDRSVSLFSALAPEIPGILSGIAAIDAAKNPAPGPTIINQAPPTTPAPATPPPPAPAPKTPWGTIAAVGGVTLAIGAGITYAATRPAK